MSKLEDIKCGYEAFKSAGKHARALYTVTELAYWECVGYLLERLEAVQAEEQRCRESEENAIRRMDEMGAELEKALAQLCTCETCDGDGIMSVVCGYDPMEGEKLEDTECAECHGTGVSSWGQAIDRAEKAETKLEQMRLGCKETSDRLVQTQLENVRLKSEVTQTAARLHAEEQSATGSGGILSSVCDLVFDDPRRALDHGYDGVEDKIVEIINKLKLHQIQVSKYCTDICTEGKAVQDLCKTCPLGKLRG